MDEHPEIRRLKGRFAALFLIALGGGIGVLIRAIVGRDQCWFYGYTPPPCDLLDYVASFVSGFIGVGALVLIAATFVWAVRSLARAPRGSFRP